MVKLVQICASQNDLFGLGDDGVVYQYNFKTHNWLELGHGPDEHRELPLGEGPSAGGQPRARTRAPARG
jgi:hypothetical protein